ncbi:MAG: hypothetical protein JXA19_06375 [Anaerolineales bacterium]|nr:hypothetical protein [Anaerolineales bacterium]
MMVKSFINNFLKLSRLDWLLVTFAHFTLGLGIAKYLGKQIIPARFLPFFVWLLLLQLASAFLYEYFKVPFSSLVNTPPPDMSHILGEGEGKLPRVIALLGAFASLTGMLVFTVQMLMMDMIHLSEIFFLSLILVVSLLLVLPPIRLLENGFGEVALAILIVNLVPAIAFLSVTGYVHRLVALSTAPLPLVFLAGNVVWNLERYYQNVKFDQKTFLTLIGWENGFQLHNLFLFTAYILIGVSTLLGLSPSIIFPVYFTLPLAIFQIIQIQRIGNGKKPNWQIIKTGSIALYGIILYLIEFSFWTR